MSICYDYPPLGFSAARPLFWVKLVGLPALKVRDWFVNSWQRGQEANDKSPHQFRPRFKIHQR